MSQRVKTLATNPNNLNFISQNLCKCGRKELTPQRCSLASTCLLWHVHPHKKTKNKKQNTFRCEIKQGY